MLGSRCRKSSRWLRLRIGLAALLTVFVLLFGRASFHLARVAWNDGEFLLPAPAGFVDDASRMNLSPVAEIIDIPVDPVAAEHQIVAVLARARAQGLKVSIAGARHTMGGHTIYPGGIALNMETFNRFELDQAGEILHAQSGARWDQIIPYLDQRGRSILIMQSNNSFTVGGSISANCHGWQPNHPPIASSVLGFRLVKADGSIVRCSREENAELFSLVLGGYGLFGVILDVDLQVCINQRYRCERFEIPGIQCADTFEREVEGHNDVGLAYGRLCVAPEHFLREAVVNVFRQSPCAAADVPDLTSPSLGSLKRTISGGDLLNVTVRHVLTDQDSFLRYADREMLALVLLFNQPRTPEADMKMQAMTQELIDAALEAGGRYYLPYRLHASVEQFDRAYPQGREFFDLKRQYDPDELFQNEFYIKYGRRE